MIPFFGSKTDALYTLYFTIGFEVITCFFRFVLKKKSTQNTGFIGRCTGGFRIHHGYVGLVLILVRNWFPNEELAHAATWIGWGCVLSDGIHHFWILWPFTGSHDFDLVYPVNSFPRLTTLEANLRGNKDFTLFSINATAILVLIFFSFPR